MMTAKSFVTLAQMIIKGEIKMKIIDKRKKFESEMRRPIVDTTYDEVEVD